MSYDFNEHDVGFIELFAAYTVLVHSRMAKSPLGAVIAFMESHGEFDWGYRVSDLFCDAHGRSCDDGQYVRVMFGVSDPNMSFEIKMRFG